MTSSWSFDAEPPTTESGVITLVEQTSFCIGSRNGNLSPGSAHGLFFRDTRILSRWTLAVDGAKVQPLTASTPQPFSARFVGRARLSKGRGSTLLVERVRYVGNGMREDVVIRNLTAEPITTDVMVTAAADFADLFEVKEHRVKPAADIATSADGDTLLVEHQHFGERRGIRLVAHTTSPDGNRPAPGWNDSGTISFQPTIPGHQSWSVSFEVRPIVGAEEFSPSYPLDRPIDDTPAARRARAWVERSPGVSSPDEGLLTTLTTSLRDLGALRLFDPEHPSTATIAAGAPWFMALFGRDSLFASFMALPLDQRLALGTLRTLARYQGTRTDELTEEEPGRILHEMRLGVDTKLSLGGGNVYYGTVDATPLFVMLLGELHRWGGLSEKDRDELLPAADRALDWIGTHGNLTGDGFVRYQRKTDRGLANQGWKDSWDGINFADGRLPTAPIALCEVQGYTYAAYRARAELARDTGDATAQQRWTDAAEHLKEEFNRRFWLDGAGWYAVALDGDGAPVDSLTSNIGHCLWTGIVEDDKAAAVAERLVSPEMFTGWGVRTLATSMDRYNPMSYHNGSVWPHDSAIVASGLMRYGFTDEAKRIATGLFDAADAFGGRLPELFCGFDRGEFDQPVPFPTACSPQAWAAAAPIHLLRTLLRLNPSVPEGVVMIDPVVPEPMLPLQVENLHVGDARLNIDVQLYKLGVEGLTDNLSLSRESVPIG